MLWPTGIIFSRVGIGAIQITATSKLVVRLPAGIVGLQMEGFMKSVLVIGFLFAFVGLTPAWAARHQTATVPSTIDAAAVPAYPLEGKARVVVKRAYRPRAVASVRREHHHYTSPPPPKTAPVRSVATASAAPEAAPYFGATGALPGLPDGYEDGIAAPMPKVVRSRPNLIEGTLEIAGKKFRFASGGNGWSIPYGTFEITPSAVGSWGARHGAVGLANDSIYDRQLGRNRDGIEMHASSHFTSAGCVVVDQWVEFKRTLFAFIDGMGQAFLHVGPTGAIITAAKTSPLPPMIYLAERVKEAPAARHRYAGLHHWYRHRTYYAGA